MAVLGFTAMFYSEILGLLGHIFAGDRLEGCFMSIHRGYIAKFGFESRPV